LSARVRPDPLGELTAFSQTLYSRIKGPLCSAEAREGKEGKKRNGKRGGRREGRAMPSTKLLAHGPACGQEASSHLNINITHERSLVAISAG